MPAKHCIKDIAQGVTSILGSRKIVVIEPPPFGLRFHRNKPSKHDCPCCAAGIPTRAQKVVSRRSLVATELAFADDFYSKELGTKLGHPIFRRQVSPFYQGEKWSVHLLAYCLNKNSQWEVEPLGSQRDDAYYGRCRFDTIEKAIEALDKANDTQG